MSDLCRVLTGAPVELTDGAYEERAERDEHAVEAFLRQWLGRLARRPPSSRRRRQFLQAVNACEAMMQALDNAALRRHFDGLRGELRRQGLKAPIAAEAFALVREAAYRTLGKRPYDVQILGGWIILCGMVAEMQTGEGKSLTATLPAVIAAAAGASVHVVTVNDYLAGRDAEHMRPLYQFLGLRVGLIVEDMEPLERASAYACEICYVSNKELVFDYLKDRLVRRHADARAERLLAHWRGQSGMLLLRGLHLAIIDEADSVLIDEARTPLIISRTEPDLEGESIYGQAILLAKALIIDQHFKLTADRQIELSIAGRHALQELAQPLPGLWQAERWREEVIRQALTALWLFNKDQHYIITDGAIQIVDESTGRVMADRTWERGLHQLIEAKEGCDISAARETLAKMTYQRFFRRYVLLGGMTGTARDVSSELWQTYELPVVTIPTHRPPKRQRLPDYCFLQAESRWRHVVERTRTLAALGRPVLIGTRSVAASETVSRHLQTAGIAHRVLNARQDQEEADIVTEAGEASRVTVATNMAGRGTDIALGEGVAEAGGLHVILTEYHASRRIDRQLIGRCARQGDPGSAEAIVSLDDELFEQFVPGPLRWCRSWLSQHGGERVPNWMLRLLVRFAQGNAGRQEARSRQATLKMDKKQRDFLAFAGKVE